MAYVEPQPASGGAKRSITTRHLSGSPPQSVPVCHAAITFLVGAALGTIEGKVCCGAANACADAAQARGGTPLQMDTCFLCSALHMPQAMACSAVVTLQAVMRQATLAAFKALLVLWAERPTGALRSKSL